MTKPKTPEEAAEWIENESFRHLDAQKKLSANVRKSDGEWSAAEEDCYTMGFETGARVGYQRGRDEAMKEVIEEVFSRISSASIAPGARMLVRDILIEICEGRE